MKAQLTTALSITLPELSALMIAQFLTKGQATAAIKLAENSVYENKVQKKAADREKGAKFPAKFYRYVYRFPYIDAPNEHHLKEKPDQQRA